MLICKKEKKNGARRYGGHTNTCKSLPQLESESERVRELALDRES